MQPNFLFQPLPYWRPLEMQKPNGITTVPVLESSWKFISMSSAKSLVDTFLITFWKNLGSVSKVLKRGIITFSI